VTLITLLGAVAALTKVVEARAAPIAWILLVSALFIGLPLASGIGLFFRKQWAWIGVLVYWALVFGLAILKPSTRILCLFTFVFWIYLLRPKTRELFFKRAS
jgi:hypothetical protein